MVCCSQISSEEFKRELMFKLKRIPKCSPMKLHMIHDIFIYILKNIDAVCENFICKNEFHVFKPFLELVIKKIDVIENNLPTYKHPYEHKRELLNDLDELRRIVSLWCR
jgi:hypothetical protein